MQVFSFDSSRPVAFFYHNMLTKVYLITCKTDFYSFVSVAVFIPNSTWFGILPQKKGITPRLETTESTH